VDSELAGVVGALVVGGVVVGGVVVGGVVVGGVVVGGVVVGGVVGFDVGGVVGFLVGDFVGVGVLVGVGVFVGVEEPPDDEPPDEPPVVGTLVLPPSTGPYTRVAPKSEDQRTGTSRTVRPVRGASTIMPLPAYIATWWICCQLLVELKNSRSPGSSE
jgi:hypothetical protein